MKTKFIIVCCFVIQNISCFLNHYPSIEQEPLIGDPGDPLYLTPLIEKGQIQEARKLSEVNLPRVERVKSYSGYLTVNKQFNSNLFFWFFPAEINYENAPVLLWLQGGPGATSMIGLFTENGPFVALNKRVKLRKYSWTKTNNVIYIDNPVGSGYSFTNGGYVKDQETIGNDLYNALIQFFKLFPELQKNNFFVTGESYAGKYVPAVSYTIHTKNPTAPQKINLQGLSIGNGFCDPINQVRYSDYLFQLGLIDSNGWELFKSYEDKVIKYVQNKQWSEAAELMDELMDGDLTGHGSLFKNITGFENYFNFLVSNETSNKMKHMSEYVQMPGVRAAIHVGSTPFNFENKEVEKHLLLDAMQSVAPWIAELLNHYRILIYNGQLDIIVAYPLTENFLKNLEFSGASEYKVAERHQWHVGKDLAGYFKEAGNLTEVLVRNAGHMVPTDQPKWARDLIMKFVQNEKLN